MSKVFSHTDIKTDDVTMDGALHVKVRWLITKEMGANNFAMRLFEVETEGHSPLHKHAWEHEVFILEGNGTLSDGEEAMPFKAGDVVFVPPNEMHQFVNAGKKLLRFLCLIPYSKE
jgi:quercetin dioxygenase-like cupin family protein